MIKKTMRIAILTVISCFLYMTSAFASNASVNVTVSGINEAAAGEKVVITVKTEIAENTDIQGLQIDFNYSDNFPSSDFIITSNTTGWENVGITKKNLLAVGKANASASEITGTITFEVPNAVQAGEKYVFRISDAIGANANKETQAEVNKKEWEITVKESAASGSYKTTTGGIGGGNSISLPEEKSTPNKLFDDVKQTDWFYDAVKFAFENGITSGVSETAFAPNDKVTRGQFITMLCRAYNISEMTGDNFADSGNTWYTGYLAAAKQLRISNGVGDNKFAPDKEITREEMVTVIYNYLKSISKASEEATGSDFADNALISDWAKTAVSFASKNGIVKGKDNNMFDPQGTATRAELAQILYNLLNIS